MFCCHLHSVCPKQLTVSFPKPFFLYLKVLQAEEAVCLKTEGKGREHGHLKEMTEIQNGWEGGVRGQRSQKW